MKKIQKFIFDDFSCIERVQYAMAEKNLERAYEIRKQKLGPFHPRTGQTLKRIPFVFVFIIFVFIIFVFIIIIIIFIIFVFIIIVFILFYFLFLFLFMLLYPIITPVRGVCLYKM